MTTEKDAPQPVVRLELRRINAAELVQNDELLRTAAFVRALDGEATTRLLGQGTPRRFNPSTPVFTEGDPGQTLLWVLRGEARLMSRRDGQSQDFGTAAKGDVLGESEALSGAAARSYSAVAISELDVLELPRAAVDTAGQRCPALLELLRSVERGRRSARDEMSDFLSRW